MAFIVLITGIVGGLIIVFSILLLCKYCINRKNLREAEQMKLLYETLNRATVLDSNRFYQCGNREFSRLEPRRSNPLDHYQLPETQREISTSKPVTSDYHTSAVQGVYNQSYHDNREQNNNKQHDSHIYANLLNDDQPAEQYLQVDPRCYVRQKSNALITSSRKTESPRLEKGHSINVDTRPSPTSSSLSPYRQSSFDVALARHSPNEQQSLTPSPATSTQQDFYFTPRGSCLSVIGNISTGTPLGSQHLSPPISSNSRQNSVSEKKDLATTLHMFGRESPIRSSIVHREHEHSRSLEHSTPTNDTAIDKQSRSFDAVHPLQLDIHRGDDAGGNRRAKSYECAEEGLPPASSPIAPPPIVIKIPDMRELVQAAQFSHLQNNDLDGFQGNSNRRSTLARQIIINNQTNEGLTTDDFWRIHQSYEYEEQQQQDGTSPDDLSPDLFTSTSIDSAGAMAIHQAAKAENNNAGLDEDLSKYDYRRKSSSNLLLPPPEVRRQALRRTCEKRRRCINQSNAKREQQSSNNQIGFNDDYEHSHQSSTMKSTDFSSLLNNFNSKSANSSFDRSLETDFDMQSDTSSRGLNDHFTSIESSTNENPLPDITQRLPINKQFSSHQDDSGYKSLESQNSQNHTFSLDCMSADGVESVIYIDQSRKQQERISDLKDLQEDLDEQQISQDHRSNSKFEQTSSTFNLLVPSNSNTIEQRSVSPKSNSSGNKLLTTTSFNRTASKKRREFGKDKRHAASNIGLPHLITPDDHQFPSPMVHQINEVNTKQSSTLQVRYPDVRRSKSEDVQLLDSPPRKLAYHSNEPINTPTQSSSSANDVLQLNSIRLNQSEHSPRTFQRSPSSATPPMAISPQIVAFRSKRGSISFDNPISPLHSPTTKISPTYSTLSTSVTKPRLKFSMVRDTTTSSLGSTSPNYSMALANDLTIDEKTNRIINEFLMQDNNNKDLHSESTKYLSQQIRQQTFDERMMMMNNYHSPKATQQQRSRTALIKERQHSSVQVNNRQQSPSLHHTHSNIYPELQNNSPLLQSTSRTPVRRDNTIAVSSPSIIVTGYESSS